MGRTLSDAGFADNVGMTTEKCIAFCVSKGYQYAGTEYSQECYCGAQPAAAATLVAESQCQTPCKGNTTQPCGGGSRLNMYYTSQQVGPQVNPGVDNYGSIGCYSEGTNGRTLTYGPPGLDGSKMTVAMCVGACKAANFQIAGVEYSGECCKQLNTTALSGHETDSMQTVETPLRTAGLLLQAGVTCCATATRWSSAVVAVA